MNLPKGWKLDAIKNCCTVVSGSTPKRNKPEYWKNGNIPWVTPKDLSKLNSSILEDTPEKITKLGYDSCSTTLLPRGSILFSSRAPIGYVAIAGKDMCTNQGFKSLIPNDSVNSNYLYWCMRRYAKNIEDLGAGSTFKEVSKGIVENFKIPLPPIASQRRIADILDKADEIIRKRKEAIALTEQLLKSTFLDMFGDPVINPKGWDVVTLEQVAEKEKGAIKCGPFGSQLLISEFQDIGIPVYGIDNVQKNEFIWAKPKFITREKYQQLRAFSIKLNDVLISRTGTVGRTCIAPPNIPESIIGANLLKVSLDQNEMSSKYLSYALSYSEFLIQEIKNMSPGATVPVFNTSNLKSLKLANPPMDLQIKFNLMINKIQEKIGKQKKSLQESENLFNSLLQKAFKGEL
ncbi:restriction endonuclease subunit S [Planktothrix agardhii 1806]|uniref:restriction endonuclease subunit S n=1 Tax=Planktothrix agardhii TaxID=1160 RepID=UPI001F35C7A2|nr:restriction endonuclease subunit S [Planktothrix agardhii]MCF3601344.1 restriction endonuclease subunit S [Planktothrix agardhii 1804]MCF3617746.1 restriction endonuclease subunit S [Planktothrix agardhii 1806]